MSRSTTAKRQSKRTKAVVPVRVRVAGSKDSHLAHTLDVSNHGVKLGGCRAALTIGDHIEIQYRQKNAQFKIVWVTDGIASERQFGAECLEPGKQVWGEHFSEQADEYDSKK